MKPYKELLFKKHNEFDYSDIDEQRTLLKMEISAIVEGVDNPDAQDYHILGLVYYGTSEDNPDLEKAHGFFLSSLEIDSKYNMARLYSAHCSHDLGNYKDALKDYLSVDAVELINDFAFWRYAKLQEQIGYCYHKLGEKKRALIYFERLLGFYQRESTDTLVDPTEIFECLDPEHEIVKQIRSYTD